LPIRLRAASLKPLESHVHKSVILKENQSGQRMLFLDALRAFASVMILLHHFALYPPLCTNAEPILGSVVQWFHNYARFTQVFFVVGGYVMACSMSARSWDFAAVRHFLIRRYCRLGIPYVAAIVLAIVACAFARGWLPDDVLGLPPTLPQFVAHLFFLQDFLGYEHLSAGVWFVCINFQMGLIYVAMLFLRDALTRWLGYPTGDSRTHVPMIAGWMISVFSLFFFNLHPDWDSWAIYFFPYFFMGIVVHHALQSKRFEAGFWFYIFVVAVAMAFGWRWRLASALIVGLLVFGAAKSGLGNCWPKSRLIARMGQVSYSLFLVHFPVLIVVATVWERLGWTSPAYAVVGLFTAFLASVATSFAFHRYIEIPVAGLFRK
jgi:peptidoglycan/LPS O-acetylase OafA/YrhL